MNLTYFFWISETPKNIIPMMDFPFEAFEMAPKEFLKKIFVVMVMKILSGLAQ